MTFPSDLWVTGALYKNNILDTTERQIEGYMTITNRNPDIAYTVRIQKYKCFWSGEWTILDPTKFTKKSEGLSGSPVDYELMPDKSLTLRNSIDKGVITFHIYAWKVWYHSYRDLTADTDEDIYVEPPEPPKEPENDSLMADLKDIAVIIAVISGIYVVSQMGGK